MGHEGNEVLIKDALVFLFAVGIIVPLFRLLKLPKVVGFLIAGVALGPYALGALAETWPVLELISISHPEAAAPFAELGILFLLFLLGLEFSFETLWGMRRSVFGIGGLQAGLSTVIIGTAAFLFGLSTSSAIIIGLALALSSTAIVMQLLIDERRVASPAGHTAYGVLIFQDILVAPILIFIGFVSQDTQAGLAAIIAEAFVEGLLAIFIIFLLGRFLLRHVFRLAASVGGRDFLMALTLLTVLGAAVIMANAGLSMALGAFLAGLLLGETEFKHQTEVDLEPFKGLLLGLFFITMGMSLNLEVIGRLLPQILLGVAALLMVKIAVLALVCRLVSGRKAQSVEIALLLSPAGEFAFVILTAATAGGALDLETAAFIAAIVGISMLLNPFLGRLGRSLGSRLEKSEPDISKIDDFTHHQGHVIVVGFGRVGHSFAQILRSENAELVALDHDVAKVRKGNDDGWQVYLGDGARPEMLDRVGIAGAGMLIVTVNNVESAKTVVARARKKRPDMPIFVRAQDPDHARDLVKAGATFVIPDVIEAALQLALRALLVFGYNEETVRDRIAAERDESYFLGSN